MRRHCRVLVTGAGSAVGQGIVKALRISKLPVSVIAADISPMNAALYRADEAVIIPRVEQPDSLAITIELIRRHRIDVVMVGSEFDLEFFSFNKVEIESITEAVVVVAPPEVVAIANDKWLTTEFLRENNLPYKEAYLPKDQADAVRHAETWGYPVVLKTRRGTSSRHVHIVEDSNSLKKLFLDTALPMLQKVIDVPSSELSSEYTCSIFRAVDDSIIGPFTARRALRGGTSWLIEVAPFEALYTPLLDIAGALNCFGSLNVQLMLTDEGVIPFELNSRFSGTTAIRAHFGFNEPAMALRSFFYNEEIPPPVVSAGVAMRYHEEVFIEDLASSDLVPGMHKGTVASWF
jgi:carbamoyl-phosphate synthase large subunit